MSKRSSTRSSFPAQCRRKRFIEEIQKQEGNPMKRKLAAAIFCLSVLGTPAVASTAAGSLDTAKEPVQTASLATGALSASEREVNLKAVKYTRAEGSPFTGIIASIAPSVCDGPRKPEAVHYTYSASRPEEGLPACEASGETASIDQTLPVFTIAGSAIDAIEAEADTGLPDVPIIVNKN